MLWKKYMSCSDESNHMPINTIVKPEKNAKCVITQWLFVSFQIRTDFYGNII